VLADGQSVTVRAGDDDFAGTVVHLGALGVVTHLTLQLVPRFNLAQVVYDDLAWDVAVENFDAITSAAHSVSLFTDLTRPCFNVWLKSRDPRPDGDFLGAVRATEPRHPIAGGATQNATQQLGVPGPWYARLPHFRLEFTPSSGEELQSEYLVPRRHAVGALSTLAELAPLLAPLVQVCEIRTVAADDLWLSPAYGGDVVGLHFTWYDRPQDLATVMPRLEERLLEHDARPHWGKVFTVPAERITASYPRLADFQDLATRMDPERTFVNDYLQRTVLPG
jgi:xylitol oxidase